MNRFAAAILAVLTSFPAAAPAAAPPTQPVFADDEARHGRGVQVRETLLDALGRAERGGGAWPERLPPGSPGSAPLTGKGGEEFSGGKRDQYVSQSTNGADNIPVFADATWMDSWPRVDDPAPPDLIGGDRNQQGPEKAPKENMMARFTISRHSRSINVAFLDGHAAAVPLDNLKWLKWHREFVPQDWVPPLPKR